MAADQNKEKQELDPVDVPLFGADGGDRGSVKFTPGSVSNYPNIPLLKEAVRRQQGRLRRGTASTKTRSEIKGSNRKPWRQKGTGRARAGSRKSPIWRGGGTIFGPKPRSYDYGLPKKQRRLAVRHALLSKLLDGETKVIETLSLDKPHTKKVSGLLTSVGIQGPCLIGVSADAPKEEVRNLVRSCNNLYRVKVVPIGQADTLSLLQHQSLLLTQSAFDEVQKKEQEVEASS